MLGRDAYWGALMVDSITPSLRSEIMSRIRGKDTRPEMLVRRLIHKAGFRYRLHVASLPGKPDLVFAGRKKVIFVHGCFWHMHEGCAAARMPKSRVDFWQTKLQGNRERDRRNVAALREAGWEVLTLWECELGESDLMERVTRFLVGGR